MFGKPQWFRLKTFGWGLNPVGWQGWTYVAAWLGVMLTPYVYFLTQRQWTEGFLWLGVIGGGMLYDVWMIVGQIKRGNKPGAEAKPATTTAAAPKSDVLYIGDEPSPAELATKRYDLRLQR